MLRILLTVQFFSDKVNEREILQFSEPNWKEILTPIRVLNLQHLLKQSGYPPEKSEEIVQGFKQGLDIGYRGPVDQTDEAENLSFNIWDGVDLWNKVMKEVELGRYAGQMTPF